jgi:hypothetical protein
MKGKGRNTRFLAVLLVLGTGFIFAQGGSVLASPSTTYWSPCISDIQPFGVWHITYDSYTTVGRHEAGEDFPADYGLTVGFLPFEKFKGEIGIDLIEPTDHPVYFNVKVGTPEGALFEGSPALNVGIFNVGTKKDETDYNIVDVIAGKTLPMNLGRIHGGFYTGNGDVLVDADGNEENEGFMVGYDRFIYKDKVMFAADYASGDNAIGGGGAGLYYFFTKDISLLTGPVWFNERELNGKMKWTFQLDINF